jgi:type III secretory pathway lipoprotein EscJ
LLVIMRFNSCSCSWSRSLCKQISKDQANSMDMLLLADTQ